VGRAEDVDTALGKSPCNLGLAVADYQCHPASRKVKEMFLLLVFTGLESKRYGSLAYRNRTVLGCWSQQTSFWGTRTPPRTFMGSVPARAPRSDSWSDSEFKTQIRLEYLILIHRIDTDVVPNSAGAD
jgi:hypothetical protein